MLNTSAAYKAAVVGDARRVLLRAVVDMISPDIVYGSVTSSGESAYSKPAQLHDKVMEIGRPFATLEHNRWILGEKFAAAGTTDQVGFESAGQFGADGSGNLYVEMQFSGVSILQSCAVYFPTAVCDGVPEDFTVAVKRGGTVRWSQSYTGNTAHSVRCEGFTVENPDAIRITVTRWSLPCRRLRIPEIVPGLYEIWDGDVLAALSVTQQSAFSGLSLPYGTCTLSVDNSARRFDPYAQSGLFRSIEERQGFQVSFGVETADGVEYVPAGIFYQYSGGWRSGSNALALQWTLVDIVGLLAGRTFSMPTPQPTTLAGWIAALVAQLGSNFAARYYVDPAYASLSCTADAAKLADKTCGQILMWVCQATGTWPRARAEDGRLAVEPFRSGGRVLDFDNLSAFPTASANADIARIDFELSNGTKISVPGTNPTSPTTQSVSNPFLHTAAAAQAAAVMILASFGGNQIETTGRGDPSVEIGDVNTVQITDELSAQGRVLSQTFPITDGVLKGCKTVMLKIGDVSDWNTTGGDGT